MKNKSLHNAHWGEIEGKEVFLYKLTNGQIELTISNYGGIIQSIWAPDRNGISENIVLGYPSLEDYKKDSNYIGALIGRYANRLANGSFSIGEKNYQLNFVNNGTTLHGGEIGFNKRIWEVTEIERQEGIGIELSYMSPDMEEGFPGNLNIKVRYILNATNDLIIEYEAITDQPTPVNFTQHSYFNLSGKSKQIGDHQIKIPAALYAPLNDHMLPTKGFKRVEHSIFDLNSFTDLERILTANNEHLRGTEGYDHSFILADNLNYQINPAAELWHSKSGRLIKVSTTEPTVHFYTGNFLNMQKNTLFKS